MPRRPALVPALRASLLAAVLSGGIAVSGCTAQDPAAAQLAATEAAANRAEAAAKRAEAAAGRAARYVAAPAPAPAAEPDPVAESADEQAPPPQQAADDGIVHPIPHG